MGHNSHGDKEKMKIHYVIIAIITVSMIVLGSMSYMASLQQNYASTADLSGLNNTRDRLEAQQAISQNISDELTSFKLESAGDAFTIPYKMIKIAWLSAKQMFNSWTTAGTMITEAGTGVSENGIPLPSWFIPSLIAMLVILLGAIIVYAFFKWKFED